jgi:hypothetical protein
LAELERGIARVVDAIVAGVANEAMQARMMAMDVERLELQAH